MTHTNRIFGKITLLTFKLVGLMRHSAGRSFETGVTPKQKAKTTPAASTMKKTAAPATTKKAKTEKKKRNHTRRSTSKSTKKS